MNQYFCNEELASRIADGIASDQGRLKPAITDVCAGSGVIAAALRSRDFRHVDEVEIDSRYASEYACVADVFTEQKFSRIVVTNPPFKDDFMLKLLNH